MAATLVSIAITDSQAKSVSYLLDASVVSIGMVAALFAFFASWAAYHLTRNNEPLFFRIGCLTLLVPFLMFLALAPIGAFSGSIVVAGALVGFAIVKFSLAFVLATLAWSTIFLYLQRKRPDANAATSTVATPPAKRRAGGGSRSRGARPGRRPRS